MRFPVSISFVPAVVTSSLFSVGIDACSNYIAQRIKHWQGDNSNEPFHFDSLLFWQYVLYVAITAPINFYWQTFLERMFPGWKVTHVEIEASSSDPEQGQAMLRNTDEVEMEELRWKGDTEEENETGPERKKETKEVMVRNLFNIVKKWFADSITCGVWLNTTLFLVLMGLIKGKSPTAIRMDMRREFVTISLNSYKVWPVANFLSMTFVPAERRIIFLSFCGLIWNVYLSMVAARL